ncbi:MAG: ATP-grasp domain-containing protein [Pseudomonadota bacterium]
MARLLFTGGGGAGNEALHRHLEGAHETHFADADLDAIDPLVPADRRHAIPFAADPAFADELLALCRRLDVDILVPGVDEELPALAPLRDGAPRIMVPPAAFVGDMLDKFTFAKRLHAAGLDAPETRLLSDWSGMAFPLIAKPRSGRGSRGVMRIENAAQVEAYLAFQSAPADAFVAQELVEGDEYTVCVHADEEGALRHVVPVRVGVKKGITIAATAIRSDPIFAYAEAFQAALKPKGVYNIQCMLTSEGRVAPFEVNPRVSTTFCLALQAGFDPFVEAAPAPARHLPEAPIHLKRRWVNHFSPEAEASP